MATSTIRRKPLYTYKSPSANTPADQIARIPPTTVKPAQVATRAPSQTSTSSGNTSVSEVRPWKPIRTKYRNGPLLPLYHPRGPLALSLPPLDPAQFGLPDRRVVVNDSTQQTQDVSRRSSSRARRPAAKVRDRDRDGAEDDESPGTPASGTSASNAPNTRDPPARERPSSPRKRRAGGAASGGAKRKRKQEPDDPDGVYPPPAKRTRNPRGTANTTPLVASPLVSATVAAPVEEPEEVQVSPAIDAVEAEAETEEAPAEKAPAPEPKRSSRTRKSRSAANKRRNSSASASTNTSASVSIAANARNTRSGKKGSRSRGTPSDHADVPEKQEEEEELERKEEEEDEDEPSGQSKVASSLVDPVAPEDTKEPEGPATGQDDEMDINPPEPEMPAPLSMPPQKEDKEEREEGELSDE